jgi:putative MATE family efflux protein
MILCNAQDGCTDIVRSCDRHGRNLHIDEEGTVCERRDRVNRAVGSALALSVTGGVLLLLVGVFGARTFLIWMKCPSELIEQAVLYFRLYFVGMPIFMVYTFIASILRSTGDSRSPMVFLTIGGAVKVVLTFVFAAFLNGGVAGVACATILSWTVSALLGIYALFFHDSAVRIHFKEIRFYKTEFLSILKVGIPAGLQSSLYSAANVIITTTVNTFGAAATTGVSIANIFDGILYQISTAPALAVMPYVSQNVGNKNVTRATRSIGCGILITLVLGGVFGALSAIFSGPLSSIMSDDPAAISFSQQKMVIISSTYFICGFNEILGSALRGMGRSNLAMVTALIYMCAFRFLWVYAIFPFCPNLTFLYLVWPVSWVLSIFTLLPFLFSTVKKLRRAELQPA